AARAVPAGELRGDHASTGARRPPRRLAAGRGEGGRGDRLGRPLGPPPKRADLAAPGRGRRGRRLVVRRAMPTAGGPLRALSPAGSGAPSRARERRIRRGAKRRMNAAEKTRLVVDAALVVKAEDVIALDVKELASFADVFVVATGRSDRQVRAVADSIEKAMREGGEPVLGVEGYPEGRWVLIDLADVIVHVFQPESRAHYDIERLWSDAPQLAVPHRAPAAPAEKRVR